MTALDVLVNASSSANLKILYFNKMNGTIFSFPYVWGLLEGILADIVSTFDFLVMSLIINLFFSTKGDQRIPSDFSNSGKFL